MERYGKPKTIQETPTNFNSGTTRVGGGGGGKRAAGIQVMVEETAFKRGRGEDESSVGNITGACNAVVVRLAKLNPHHFLFFELIFNFKVFNFPC
jgi:hypothetical protein